MKFIWSYLKKHPKLLVLNVFGALMFVLVNLGLPTVLAHMIDEGILPHQPQKIYFWAGVMLVIILLGAFGRIVLAYVSSRLTAMMITDMRKDLYEKMQAYSHEEYEKIGVSSLVTRITNDVFILKTFAEQALRMGVITIMMNVSSLVMIVLVSPDLAWVVLVCLPFLTATVWYVAVKTKPLSEKQQSILDKLNQIVRENLIGLRVIRAFARESFEEERFAGSNDQYMATSSKLYWFTGLTEPLFVQIIIAMIVTIIVFSLNPISQQTLHIGNLVAFIEYAFHALFSFLLFAGLFTLYPRMAVATQRIREVLDMPLSIYPNENGVTETETRGYLTFDNVTFAYPGETENPVLQHISFETKPGETIAFIGSTGSGKSSLVHLIPRFHDVTLGRILVDGVDVRDYQLKALREKIGFIPQKSLLFTGTVGENLRYGKEDASIDELDQAIDVSQAKNFVLSDAAGYDRYLSEGGSNLSGGQKQRLAIARAIVKKPDIYIFDDNFSALDYQTDALVRQRLKEVTGDATVLIVAQRVGTIMNADQIIVLNEGKIVGRGTHDELMANNAIYREIAESQLNNRSLIDEEAE